MPEKLKPCPFCKNEYMLTIERIGWAEKLHVAGCCKCLAQGPICDSEEDAIIAWNNRPDIRHEAIKDCLEAISHAYAIDVQQPSNVRIDMALGELFRACSKNLRALIEDQEDANI